MYCKNCGKQVDDRAAMCIHCGCMLQGVYAQPVPSPTYNTPNNQVGESKTAIGVLLSLFLGLIGLIIGICLYKEGTRERSTFIKGWLITFIVSIIIGKKE